MTKQNILAGLILLLIPLGAHAVPPGPPTSFTSAGPGGGGALFAPSFSPFASSEMYVASDRTALFHTHNYGASWDTLDFRQIQASRTTQVQFTSSASILYAIDFTPGANVSYGRPAKSGNGGATWNARISDPTGGNAWTIWADPASTQRVLLSSIDTLYYSSDGGASWTQKFIAGGVQGLYVGGVFWDGTHIYVGTSNGILVSNDNGASFSAASITGFPSGKTIAGFAGSKLGTTIRFFCTTYNAFDIFPGVEVETLYNTGSYGGVFTLDYGAATWTSVSGLSTNFEPFFVAMAAGNISTVYLAGQDKNVGYPSVYRTLNAGGAWSSVFKTVNNSNILTGWEGYNGDRDWAYGYGAMGLSVASNNANLVAVTDLGTLHLSADGGNSWQQTYVAPADQNAMNAPTPKGHAYHSSGLENTRCWWMEWSDVDNLFTGFSDIRGSRSSDGGVTWSFNYTGYTDNTMYHITRGVGGTTLFAATASVPDVYQKTRLTDMSIDSAGGKIIYSTNHGVNWSLLHDFSHPVVWVGTDPQNVDRVYASVASSTAGGIYTTANATAGSASTWTRLPANSRTEGHPYHIEVLNDGTLVASYSARRAQVNGSLHFTPSSGVFVSTDNGQTWQDRSDGAMEWWTQDITIDPNDPAQNTWFATVFGANTSSGNVPGGMFRTTDRGAHWTQIVTGDNVMSCTFNPDPKAAGELYYTTETNGLWYTSNANAASPVFSRVTTYPFRQPMRVFFNPFNPVEMWVMSHGNGMRVATVGTAQPPAVTSSTSASGTQGDTFSYQITAGGSPTSYGATGLPAGLTIDTQTGLISGTPTESGTFNVTISATDAAGTGTATLTITLAAAPATPTPTPTATPTPNAQSFNISTRVRVLTEDKVLIGGFIITGNQPKRVIIRALGPSLANAGISDVLSDPMLELRGNDGSVVAANDDWKSSQEAEIIGTGVPPQDDHEAAIVQSLQPGAYTAVVSGKNGGTGVGLVEIYDLDSAAASKLANISTRGFVDTGNNVMIGGFIVGPQNASPASYLIRGIGPSLANFGIAGALADPVLELHDNNGNIVQANDNWQDSQAAAISATGLPPSDPHESAMVSTLPPGAFTAVVRGNNDTVGVGLVEIYNLQ